MRIERLERFQFFRAKDEPRIWHLAIEKTGEGHFRTSGSEYYKAEDIEVAVWADDAFEIGHHPDLNRHTLCRRCWRNELSGLMLPAWAVLENTAKDAPPPAEAEAEIIDLEGKMWVVNFCWNYYWSEGEDVPSTGMLSDDQYRRLREAVGDRPPKTTEQWYSIVSGISHRISEVRSGRRWGDGES